MTCTDKLGDLQTKFVDMSRFGKASNSMFSLLLLCYEDKPSKHLNSALHVYKQS